MELGQVVLSRCGRDKDKYFIVVGIDKNKEYVLLSDGELRRIEKPKKKNIKHINPMQVDHVINDKLANGLKITNPELKKHIKNIIEENSGNHFKDCVSDDKGGCKHG